MLASVLQGVPLRRVAVGVSYADATTCFASSQTYGRMM